MSRSFRSRDDSIGLMHVCVCVWVGGAIIIVS
jgi:hypothetical protein